MTTAHKKPSLLKRFWGIFGPGLITGASDDDPSGIATYTQAGAAFGSQLLWSAIVTYPLMVSVQEMCARIGLVTNHGLIGIIKKYYPKYLLYLILIISFPSITLNIGADIAGMGAVGNLLFPVIPAFSFSILFTALILYSVIFWSYHKIAVILKWLCISLVSYILIPFLIGVDWPHVLRDTFLPSFTPDKAYFLMLVGILGTTISPYLFFWQASMEVEERHEKKLMVDKKIIEEMEADVKGGMLFTNVVFYFIILAAGTVLFNAGIHNINTVEEAARALRPLAGDQAYLLFALGVIGTGFLAIPVLGGALSYMMAETFGWKEGLDKKYYEAPGFYLTMAISLVVGLLIHFIGISPIQALIYTAVLYGITAPVLIALILHICNSKKIMGRYTNKFWSNFFGIATFIMMTVSSLFLLWYTLGN
ncbi:divalent metal cation transporter [Chlorobium sp. BLA1]|uniref:NRAMP family divalent metal transporter n=1 Tax=Candidatus Chlorobium masyuteum TaxID=2716876 RepID=UPI0014205673|nr:divalent metal cation transporter [Candidatus Chlorobium masyuteum]NHQ60311.1 divalent metal cation transporter [Candidatus Chlorobium masyuteum]NTU44117.1 divalent metal cation transporter [Chlorobiaceae bacterium]